MTPRIVLVLLLVVVGEVVTAQPVPVDLEEAPESLVEFEIGDAEVELSIAGTLRSESRLGLAWNLGADRSDPAGRLAFPGMQPTVPILNRIDLTISLRLLERYFFETSILATGLPDALERSLFLFGYQGLPGELVQSVLIGNTGIEIGSYPYLGFGGDSANDDRAPGASVRLATPTSTHEAMLRFSPTEEESIRYAGGGIVNESRVNVADFERARHFVLPDGLVGDLVVYVETASSSAADGVREGDDGKNYRIVDLASETSFSLSDGVLSFRTAQKHRILVFYTVGGVPVGDATLGEGAYFALDEGRPDPDAPRRFALTGPELAFYLETIAPDATEIGAVPPTLADVTVGIDGITAFVLFEPGRYSPFERTNHYALSPSVAQGITVETPLGARVETAVRFTPHPARGSIEASGAAAPRAFANRYPFATGSITPGQSGIYAVAPTPGSLDLVARQTVAAERIALPDNYVPSSVRITRNGRRETNYRIDADGTIVFDSPLTSSDSVDVRYRVLSGGGTADVLFGIGNRFEPTPGVSISVALGTRFSPGSGRYSSRIDKHPGYLVVSGSAGFDSARLERGGPGHLTAEVSGAVSVSTPDTTGVLRVTGMDDRPPEIAISPARLARASVPVVDPDPVDGIDIDATTRGSLLYRDYYQTDVFGNRTLLLYDPGSPPSVDESAGPYVAGTVDSGVALVLEYILQADANWVGAQLHLPPEIDFSRVTAIELPYLYAPNGATRVFVEVGAIGEEVDSDGDGIVGRELPDRIVTREVTLETGAWRKLTIEFSSAERRTLARSRAIRLLVQRDGAGERSGTLLVGTVALLGSGFALTTPGAPATPSPIVRVESTVESTTDVPRLADDFPDVARRLLPADRPNRYLLVEWSGMDPGTVVLRTPVIVPAESYEELRVYARNPGGATANVTLSARDERDQTIAESTMSLAPGGWSVLVTELPAASTSIVASVVITIAGGDSGTVYLDELTFWTPRGRAGVVSGIDVDWRPPLVLRAGDVEIVADVRVRQSLYARTPGFADGLADGVPGVSSGTSLESRLLGSSVSLGIDLASGPGGTGHAARHRITVPIAGERASISDSFNAGFGVLGARSVHAISAAATIAGAGRASFDWSGVVDEGLESAWKLNATTGGSDTGASARLELEERSARSAREGYFASWVRSFADALPTEEASTRRMSGLLQSDVAIARSHADRPQTDRTLVALRGTLRAETGSSDRSGRTDASVSGGLAVPLTLPGRATLTATIDRAFEVSIAGAPASASADLASAITLLRASPLPFTSVPGWEVVDPEYLAGFTRETGSALYAAYTPSIGLEFSRPVVSAPLSLLLPAAARATVARPAVRDLDATSSRHRIDLGASFIGPNLFGRLGSAPVFGFYDTDEIQTRVESRIERNDAGAWSSEHDVNQRIELAWLAGQRLTMVNSLKTTTPEGEGVRSDHAVASSLSLAWRAKPETSTAIAQRIGIAAEGARIEHTDRIDVAWEELSTRLRSAFVRHETRFIAANRSQIRVHTGLGVAFLDDGAERTIFGVELGIEGTLQF